MRHLSRLFHLEESGAGRYRRHTACRPYDDLSRTLRGSVNVVVRSSRAGDQSTVETIDPQALFRLSGNEQVGEVADETDTRLKAALYSPVPDTSGWYSAAVLIFLPPSEGKSRPGDPAAARLQLTSLTLPELTEVRESVARALIDISHRTDAQSILKVGARVMDEVAENRHLWDAPTAPAHKIYTGVLFGAMGVEHLSPQAHRRAQQQVLIFSGLFGVTGFSDRIPAHRLSMGVDLSDAASTGGLAPGRLGSFWRGHLKEPLQQLVGDQLVIDCRSSTYAAAFRAAPEQTLSVNSVTEHQGVRKVVTHFAKHARGELTSMLLEAERPARSVDDVAKVASSRWEVEVRPAVGRTSHQLDLITLS